MQPGFSLLELVIVVAVTGILLSIAVPGYQGFMLRAHRTEAISSMLQIATCQERIYAARMSYDTSRCLPAAGARYVMEYLGEEDGPAAGYTLIARPNGMQAGDPCGSLILDQTGNRLVGSESADPVKCWAGR